METITYKSFDDTSLEVTIYYPPEGKKATSMMILFFGGGWMSGNPLQFHQYAMDLTSYGMVVATPQYRTLNNHGTRIDTAVKDAIYAVGHLTTLANEMDIPTEKVVLGGGSAGGHLALTSVLLDRFIPEDFTYQNKIKSLVLFNPVVDTVEFQNRCEALALQETSYEGKDFSPAHNIKDGIPDMLLLHGKSDTTVPIDTVRSFTNEVNSKGYADCRLIEFEEKVHGFFNFRPTALAEYYRVLGEVVNFLYEKEYINIEFVWK